MSKRSLLQRMKACSQILPWAIAAALFLPGGFVIGGGVIAGRFVFRFFRGRA